MSGQGSLFSFDQFGGTHPVTHRADPETSREAASSHIASGNRERNANIVLELVKRFPGSTAVELWEQAGDAQQVLKEMQEVRRRLVDLESAGVACKGDARPCKVKSTKMVVWNYKEKQ